MMSHKRRRTQRGFTLLEILIVVGILALLAAFVVPSLLGRGQQARINLAKTAIGRSGIIAGALKHYQLDVGVYPETDDGLAALYERPSHIEEDSKIWQGPYLETPPDELRDPWDEAFIYVCPGKFNENGYDLSSKGPDRQEDTEDDIKNWTEK